MEDQSFGVILNGLKDHSNKRDPRSIRLAAVTAALLEVVGEDQSASRVYANVITALEGTLSKNGDVTESLSTQTALLEILEMTVPHVKPTIISATLTLSSRVLRGIVTSSQTISNELVMETKDDLGGVSSVLRHCCRVAAEILRFVTTNTDEKTVKQFLMGTLVTLFFDRRPKVRKASQNSIIELLMMEDPHRCHQIVYTTITNLAHSEIRRALKEKKNDSRNELLHVLGFLERSINLLEYQKLGTDVMELLSSMFQIEIPSSASDYVAVVKMKDSTPKILIINECLSVVQVLCENHSSKQDGNIDKYSARVLASLLQASPSLIYRDGAADFDVLQRGRILYGQLILSTSRRVLTSQSELGHKLLPISIQLLLVLSKPNESHVDDTSVAHSLMPGLTQIFRDEFQKSLQESVAGIEKCRCSVLENMQQVFNPIYRPTWPLSLKAFVVFIQIVYSSTDVAPYVEKLVQLRNDSSPGTPSQHAVQDAVASLIQGVGIEQFWSWVNWHEPGKMAMNVLEGVSRDRAWLLSTMKAAALVTQPRPRLQFFQSEILGLARVCDRLANSRQKEKVFHQARVVELWALLPCFCKSPYDLQESLPSLTTILSRAIEDKRYPALVSIICNALTTLCSSIHDTDKSSRSDEVLSSMAKDMLPLLFKMVSESNADSSLDDAVDENNNLKTSESSADKGQRIHLISEAISSLAKITPSKVLNGLFKKLMQKLLEEIQSEKLNGEKICSFLSLAQALVSSGVLEDANVSFLYRVLKPLIQNDEQSSRVQKRAYKVLAELCEKHHSFVADLDRLKELSSLLTGTITTAQIAARHMRLKCMSLIVEGLDEQSKSRHLDEIFKVIVEILVCLKDPNAKTREAGYQLLLSMAKKDDIDKFLQVLTAALGAQTPHLRSASVMALSRVVYELAWDDERLHSSLPSLLQTVMLLIDENSREVVKSVIGFLRISVAAIQPSQLEPLLPELMEGLLKYHKHKSRFRAKIKIILKKLVKRYGYEVLMPLVPETETRLLTHMRKLDERQSRRKAAMKEELSEREAFDDMLESDEEDSDDGRTLMTGVTGFTRMTGRTEGVKSTRSDKSRTSNTNAGVSMVSGKSKLNGSATIQLPNEADGEVVDMLGSKMAKKVKFAEDQSDEDDSDDGMMEFDDDGRLIVRDVNEDELALQDDSPNKRQRVSKYEDAKNKKEEKHKKRSAVIALGSAYKSNKAGGDVKKKGQKFEPYAFVPLDGKSYSRKNRQNAVNQMSTVVRGTGKRKRK